MHCTTLIALFLFLSSLMTAAPKERTPNFEFIDVPGAEWTQVNGINADRNLVGSIWDEGVGSRAFSRVGGQFETLHYPNALATSAQGIDDFNRVVGYFYNEVEPGSAFSLYRGFLYENGRYTEFQYPGFAATIALDINNSGQIVGFGLDEGYNAHGFLLLNGQWTALDYPGARSTVPYGVDYNGTVVGWTSEGHGFVWEAGSFRPLRFSVDTATYAVGVDDGLILGAVTTSGGTWQPFTVTRYGLGKFSLLDLPVGTNVSGIASGYVVGSYLDYGTVPYVRGFIARISSKRGVVPLS